MIYGAFYLQLSMRPFRFGTLLRDFNITNGVVCRVHDVCRSNVLNINQVAKMNDTVTILNVQSCSNMYVVYINW